MKYAFITQNKKAWPVSLLCDLFNVTRNGYYSYQQRRVKQPQDPHWQNKIDWVKEVAEGSDNTYGYRRMREALQAGGYPVSRGETRKLMKAAGVKVKQRKRFKVTTDSHHKKPLYDNVLDRAFEVGRPDQAYVQDITYIWTQEGWLYLAVVIDLFHREVVGWSMSSRMTSGLVCDALTMAIWRRQPRPGLVVHSDRGSQYASKAYRQLLSCKQFVGSMSRKGNCWDNAVAESFFGTLKQERVQWCSYQSRLAAQQDVLRYIVMHYNSKRLHSTLGYMSPMTYEAKWKEARLAA